MNSVDASVANKNCNRQMLGIINNFVNQNVKGIFEELKKCAP